MRQFEHTRSNKIRRIQPLTRFICETLDCQEIRRLCRYYTLDPLADFAQIDEHHPNDGEYAYNKNEIDFSGLIPPQDNGQGGDTEVGLPELSCETYQKLNTKFEVICNKKIKSYELPQGVEFVSLSSDKHTLVLNPTEKGIKTIKIVDVDNNNVTKKIVIKG